MNRRGFTLIELLIVIVVAGILLSIAVLNFAEYLRKGAVERQTKEMYSDLMAARTAAVTQRSPKRVIITPTVFRSISSSIGSSIGLSTTKVLSHPVTWSGKSASDTEVEIDFDERGTFNIDAGNGNTTICIEPSVQSAQYDSIVVYSTRIHLGKVAFGGACNSDNVTVK
ncbi:MAG: prepilin-type N-terminal cleavage/methylation domain-containing protein [Geobacteraceae bacterium]|nr:prepilin-type N-terminal cleavage/methylation domain-containing protein [Geobacteraceae bacterium]